MFDEIVRRMKPVPDKLKAYGFRAEGKVFRYNREACDGEFRLTVTVDSAGGLDTELIEIQNGDAYVLYKTDAVGAYVGKVRESVREVVNDVVRNCFEPAVFKSPQTLRLIEFVRSRYGDDPEFLWDRFPDNAIWRRKDNGKWYGVILTVKGSKIGMDTDKTAEITDLRMDPSQAEDMLAKDNYRPGWHMNKKSWYTLALDDSVPDDELQKRVEESYGLAGKK